MMVQAKGGRPSLAEVAGHAGVSRALASRVLNRDDTLRVRDETRQRVLAAADALGYVPNSLARGLRRSQSGSIGVVMHDLSRPVNIEVLRGAQEAAARAGFVALLGDADELARDPVHFKSALASGRMDGVILHCGFSDDEELATAMSKSVPTVLVNSTRLGSAPGVRVDDASATGLAVEHLVALGHRRIGYLGGLPGSGSSRRREQGFRAALSAAGLRSRRGWVSESGWEAGAGGAGMAELLELPQRPTAVVVANVVAAAGASSTLRERDIAVPGDMSMVAVHDAWFAPHLAPPLTTVRLPLRELGGAAVNVLLDCIGGGKPDDVLVTVPAAELVARRSTTAPP